MIKYFGIIAFLIFSPPSFGMGRPPTGEELKPLTGKYRITQSGSYSCPDRLQVLIKDVSNDLQVIGISEKGTKFFTFSKMNKGDQIGGPLGVAKSSFKKNQLTHFHKTNLMFISEKSKTTLKLDANQALNYCHESETNFFSDHKESSYCCAYQRI